MRVGARATRRVLSALLLWLTPCARAHAQSMEGCDALDGAEVTRLLGLELGTRADAGQVALRCQGLQVSVSMQPTAAAPLALDVDLRDTRSEARARVLALAIAELVDTARLDPGTRPAPPPPAPALRLGLSLSAGAARLLQPAAIGPLFALGVSGRRAALSLDADVALELASVSVEQAAVDARVLSASLAPGWHVASERLDLGLELGLRAAHAQLSAAARSSGLHGTRFSGITLLPLVRATLGVQLSQAFGARLGLEAAYVVRPLSGLDADAQSLVALRGLRLALSLAAVLWLDAP
jgi:hypothetical protein